MSVTERSHTLDKTTMVPEHLPSDYLGKDCASRARAEFWPRVITEAGAIDLRPVLVDIAQRKGSRRTPTGARKGVWR